MTIRLLIADAHVLLRRALLQLLQLDRTIQDIEVVAEASSGREAIARAVELRPDVALLDLRMPDGNGLEATRAIRKECPDTQVVILSAIGNPDLLRLVLAAGAVGYLMKDTDPESLIAAIHAAYEGKTTISPEIARQLLHAMVHTEPRTRSARSKTLTPRDLDILAAVISRLGDKEIATKLSISESTVKTHLRGIFRKLDARNRVEASAIAIAKELIALPQQAPCVNREEESSALKPVSVFRSVR